MEKKKIKRIELTDDANHIGELLVRIRKVVKDSMYIGMENLSKSIILNQIMTGKGFMKNWSLDFDLFYQFK